MLFTKVLSIGKCGTGKTRDQLISEYNKALKETSDQLERSYIENRIEALKAAQARNNAAFKRDIEAGVFN